MKRADAARGGVHGVRATCVRIEAIGARGDGLAQIDGRMAHIPYTLPGETVHAELSGGRGTALSIEHLSPDRVEPVCRHFGRCGGCALQHWREESYIAWKENLVRSALARVGIVTSMEPLRSYPTPSRRRASFVAYNTKDAVAFGYRTARGHDVVDLVECPVLVPQITSALPSLKEALRGVLPALGEARVHLTSASNGLDCAIDGPDLRIETRAKLAQALCRAGIVRAHWNGEVILMVALPHVAFAGVRVTLPPGAFLQAVEACQNDMSEFISTGFADGDVNAGELCDLFAGLGAFTFPCAKSRAVTAYEASATAVSAIMAAKRDAIGIKPVTAIRRDLFRNPLASSELKRFAAVLLDPPRQGALAQCRALASSRIGTIVMLSCNPATFARDAATFVEGGFELRRVATFDQFKFSAHVEIAALFRRPHSKRGGRMPAPRS